MAEQPEEGLVLLLQEAANQGPGTGQGEVAIWPAGALPQGRRSAPHQCGCCEQSWQFQGPSGFGERQTRESTMTKEAQCPWALMFFEPVDGGRWSQVPLSLFHALPGILGRGVKAGAGPSAVLSLASGSDGHAYPGVPHGLTVMGTAGDRSPEEQRVGAAQ